MKLDKRNQDVEFVFSLFENHYGVRPAPIYNQNAKRKFDLNRGSAQRLVKRFGKNGVAKMLMTVFNEQDKERFFKKADSPLHFEKNLTWYISYFKSKKNGGSISTVIIN